MSTDPKKFVRMALMAYFLAGMFLITGMQMSFSIVPVIIFVGLSTILNLTCMLSLWTQYRKYKIPMYLFLLFIGALLTIYGIVIGVASQI